jgi:hypothetical protein
LPLHFSILEKKKKETHLIQCGKPNLLTMGLEEE